MQTITKFKLSCKMIPAFALQKRIYLPKQLNTKPNLKFKNLIEEETVNARNIFHTLSSRRKLEKSNKTKYQSAPRRGKKAKILHKSTCNCFFCLSIIIIKRLLSSTVSSLPQSNHTRLRSGTGETSKTANFFTHTWFSRRTSIDEDQHAKHEQQRLRFPSRVHDQSHVRGFDFLQINQRGRDAGSRVSKSPRKQETRTNGQFSGGGNTGGIHDGSEQRVG